MLPSLCIGNGVPEFTVNFKKQIPLTTLMTSTSLALGEAYMDGDLEIEGDLYLSACAATFHNGIIDLHQVLFANGINNELPIVRWY